MNITLTEFPIFNITMRSNINLDTLIPGTVIAIRYTMYKHFAIVSDRICEDMPMLISLSYRTNGVEEEPWSTVVSSHAIEKSSIQGDYPTEIVLSRARSCIIRDIKYELLNFNCEHFVRYAHGLPLKSVQVRQTLYGAAIGAASCLLLPKLTVARFALLTTIGAYTSLRSSLRNI
ncbi:MAG: lecithin retinol acyltransferase family protein [Gammaproteobacteria bacterium]